MEAKSIIRGTSECQKYASYVGQRQSEAFFSLEQAKDGRLFFRREKRNFVAVDCRVTQA
jgi:hypothetical protein